MTAAYLQIPQTTSNKRLESCFSGHVMHASPIFLLLLTVFWPSPTPGWNIWNFWILILQCVYKLVPRFFSAAWCWASSAETVAPVFFRTWRTMLAVGLSVIPQSTQRIPLCPSPWSQFYAHDFHAMTSPCGSAVVQKEMAALQPLGPVEERDKGILRSRQHSGTGPVSTFTLGARDPECSDIIGLENFTAQQAQTRSQHMYSLWSMDWHSNS